MKKIKQVCSWSLVLVLLLMPLYALAFESGRSDDFYALTGSGAGVPVSSSVSAGADVLNLDAQAVLLVETKTGTPLYEKNADTPRAIASITKIMTMILVFEAIEDGIISLDDTVTVSEHAYSMGGSQIWLEPGETMTVDELLRAVAVASANDAAVALAEHVAGSEASFVVMMNQKAQELGMGNTVFCNANGLDMDGHLSTARDVSIMSRELLRHDLAREYVTIWMDELRGGETQLVNTNKLLQRYKGITGLKTGSTGNAGICISASAERDGMELIAVVLGAPNSQARFDAATDLLDFGFAHYELAEVVIPQELLTPVEVKLGKEDCVSYECDVPNYLVVEKGQRDSITCEVVLNDQIHAPVEKGQTVGEITLYSNAQSVGSYLITAVNAVEKTDFFTELGHLLSEVGKL